MKNDNRISLPVAEVLANEAFEKIKKYFSDKAKNGEVKLKQSPEFRSLQRLYKLRETAIDNYEKLEKRLERKHAIDISTYNGRVTVSAKRSSFPGVRNLKTQIIVFNQIEGVDPKHLVDMTVKKYTR